MTLPAIREMVAATSFFDTHEHLLEERTRLAGPGTHRLQPCDDAALLFCHYAGDDLWVAGMPAEEREQFFSPDVDPADKWPIVAPYWRRAQHTGYLRAVTETARQLYGIEHFDSATFVEMTGRMRQTVRPGFYRAILREAALVEVCQVNSLETTFCETEYPDLLQQDLSLIPFSTGVNPTTLAEFSRLSGLPADTLADWHAIIDWAFATYGPRACAVKSQAAYNRRLNYDNVSADDAAPRFARLRAGESLAPSERKALEDHLMRSCVRRAGEMGLPVKLHCGYYAGSDRMPLERVRQNAGDLCPLLADFPGVQFILMHIGYPYQDEYVALGKHYRNVMVDLCWAWIVSPLATARFVKEFLLAAPSNKLLTFGGDYTTVENIVGHAALARQGLSQALSELVSDGWLSEQAALGLVEPLMHGNARALFSR